MVEFKKFLMNNRGENLIINGMISDSEIISKKIKSVSSIQIMDEFSIQVVSKGKLYSIEVM